MKITIDKIAQLKKSKIKIAALSLYDYQMAIIADRVGIDIVLVGDSLGMVFKGEPNTLSVTVDDIVYHLKAVRNGFRNGFLVADMPFLSWRLGEAKALANAGKMIANGAEAVKLEGADPDSLKITEKLVKAGIPVLGHIGVLPQSLHISGGFKSQGKDASSAERLKNEARMLEESGAFAIVLEAISADLASEISKDLRIPTIGIGSGDGADGQILVASDLCGITQVGIPKFIKEHAKIGEALEESFKIYLKNIKKMG